MVERLEPLLAPLPAWLLAGAAIQTAIVSANRRPRLAVVAVIRAGIALSAAGILSHGLGQVDERVSVVSGIGALVVWGAALRLYWKRRQAHSDDEPREPLARAWLWLGGLDLAALLTLLVPRPWHASLGLALVLPAVAGASAGFAVAAWCLGRALLGAEKRSKAAVARMLGWLYAILPLASVITLGMSDFHFPALAVGALYVLAVVAPLATILLGGLRLPLSPSPAGAPAAEPDLARLRSDASLVLGLAVAGLLWANVAHLDHCRGELLIADRLPDDWPATPIVAQGIESGWLGRFRFRSVAHHHRDCGWRMHAVESFMPEYYSQAALHDPDRCFSGAVSLDASFNPFDIALHHTDGSDQFVVSTADLSIASELSPRQPIVTFRRALGWRWRLDPPWSAYFVGLAALALAVAIGLGWRRARHAQIDSGRRDTARLIRWQIRFLLLAAALPWALEGYRVAVDWPTPGHELRTHEFCRYR
jgi:hypothetical protein